MSEEKSKHPGGRPLKFASVAELQQKIDAYFAECDPHISTHKVAYRAAQGTSVVWHDEEYITEQEHYTINGLVRALDTTRETLSDYADGKYDDVDSFSDTVKKAKDRIGEYVEKRLYDKGAAAGAIFNLKNNYGWRDKMDHDVTSGGKPIPIMGGISTLPGVDDVSDHNGGSQD